MRLFSFCLPEFVKQGLADDLICRKRKGEKNMTEEVKKMLSLNIQMFAEESTDDDSEEEIKEEEKSDDKKADEKKPQEPEKKYTDDEVNEISLKNERKTARDILKKMGFKVPVNATKEEMYAMIGNATKNESKKEDSDKNENVVADAENFNKYVNSEIKVALFQANVKKEKVDRAIYLIDKSKILDDGEIDYEKLTEEIESLTKEWSDLLDTKKEDDSSLGFVVGGDGKEEKKTNSLEDIERVMGIEKKKG